MWLCLGLAAAQAALGVNFAQMYEDLYNKYQYHADLNLSHAGHAIRALPPDVTSVLDVGCSHGLGVSALWTRGIIANGVDIAPTAVEMANKHRVQHRNCGSFPCFQAASALALPFPDKSFDAIISTDVLEHLDYDDILTAFKNFVRVAKRYMVIQIATSTERVTEFLERMHRDKKYRQISHLHTTVLPLDFWASKLRRVPGVASVRVVDGLVNANLTAV